MTTTRSPRVRVGPLQSPTSTQLWPAWLPWTMASQIVTLICRVASFWTEEMMFHDRGLTSKQIGATL
jgi:hypothetical protein